MSIKDLFGKTSPSLEETVQDVESVAFVEEKTKADQTYHPQIDFSDPKNFVYYGSAELYYDAAIRRIYEDYPYDGSKSEQIAFEESASALERWMFENKYPKSTGHIQLGTSGDMGVLNGSWRETGTPEYIRVWGGLHTDNSTNLKDKFVKSAKFDEDKNRNQNWNCDFERGVTIEFFAKMPETLVYEQQVILDLWNGKSGSDSSRLLLYSDSFGGNTSLYLAIESGGGLFVAIAINSNQIFDDWGHFAITLFNEDGLLKGYGLINGEINREFSFSSTYEFTGRMDAFIGALQKPVGIFGNTYGGKFQGYLDEFRFWKTRRTARQIKLNWFQPIGGGANTDDATSDLGVYLKFNEGIVGNNQIDNVVLDYSGRLANGLWIGYDSTTNARSTISAMEQLGYAEKPSPIIYKEHSSVSALISEMQTSGSVYDADRGQSFFRSMPTWLQEEDNGNLRLFAQILGSYLDTLHVQIKELTELKTKRYPMEGVKASTMAADLLKDKGFMISNMFESNEVYEKLAAVNLQDAQFETELTEIKNIIYTNIYNNLEKIYKTKGTEGSIRNLIRCYGIDDELIRLNLYTDGGIHYFTDKSRATSVKKKYVNFNDPTRFEASIHQISSIANPNSFISGAVEAPISAFTMEADIVVPYKKEIDERGYFNTPFLSASVMGFHEADPTNPADYTWQLNGNDLQVYLVRDSLNSRHAKFVLRNLVGTAINVESDYIYDIYENEHYNVALRIKPQTYPYAGGVTNATPDYDIELYAVTTNFGEIENEVLLTASVGYADGAALMSAPKRVYVGAHVENFTGSIEQETDLQFGGVRAWLDYLGNDEILHHNKDVLNYGQRSSIDGSNLYLIDDVQIPTQDLTIFNWDFDTVTATDGAGEFVVEDITSGSTDTIYGWVDGIIRREHKAKGTDFASNDSSIIDYEFIQAYKKQLPESAYDAQNIYIKGEQEINFSDDDDVSDNLFIMEKSPAALISEEMLKSFSTTLEFANLIGRPIERFRLEYKDLAKARQLFFDKVESDMDFDKFFEYFKWIDSSISSMVNQLIPMSANFAGGIIDVIEPHMLERDKYQRQVGLLSTVTSTEASIRGVQELKYNWRVGHAPLSGDENENCLWQKERKENDVAEEEAIRQVLVRQNDQEFTNPIVLSGSTQLISGSYAARRFSRPYTLDIGFNNSIHGGINYSQNKDRDMITTQIAVGNQKNAGIPENVVLVGAGDGIGLNPKPTCVDKHKPEELTKFKYDGFAVLGKESNLPTLEPKSDENHYTYRQKVSKIIPGNFISSSVDTGYSGLINKPSSQGGFSEGYDLVNLHSDTTDITNEISIQGPFTNEHVGGRQSRHVHYMHGFDPSQGKVPSISLRPEAWNIYIAELDRDGDGSPEANVDGAIGFTTPDYSLGVLDSDQQKATFYREERAKRPMNIKNIQTIIGTGSHGNFTYNYEVMSTFGDQGYYLRRAEDLLPQPIAQALPETTNYHTLIAQRATDFGNFFGADNNRQFQSSTTPAQYAVASFVYHDNGTGDQPDLIPTSIINIQRATGASIPFRIGNNGGGTSGTQIGIYTVVDTNGTTWATVGAEFKTAIENSSFGFGTDVVVVSSADTSQVTIFIQEQTLIGTAGNGGSLTESEPYLTLVTTSFANGSDEIVFEGNIVETQDRSTGSANVIRTRFSAPGGPEINSSGYLDIATQQYSVHNSLNFRNLTTRASGSGESDRIRLDTHQVSVDEGKREGLRTLRARHQGRFGIESQYGAVSATDYVSDASFHKQHRNNQEKITAVDKTSTAVQLINSGTQFLTMTLDGDNGAVDQSTESMSFSFWFKANSDITSFRSILQITDSIRITIKTNTPTSRQFINVSLKDTGATGFKSVEMEWNDSDLNNPITEWNHYVISFNFDSLATIEATIDGVPQNLTTIGIGDFLGQFAGIPSGATFYISDGLGISSNYLDGSLMNLSYFNSFILENPNDLEILTNHRRRDEITKIDSLIGFWALETNSNLSINDVIPDLTEFPLFYGSAKKSFIATNPGDGPELLIAEGFYSYLDGERQGDERFDNDNLHSLLPASDFGYSWVHSTLSGSDSSGVTWESKQRIVDFAPRNGQVAVRGYGYVPAIVFPTISDVSCCIDSTSIDISIVYDLAEGTATITESTTLNVLLSDTATEGNIYPPDIVNMDFSAIYSGCCDTDLTYRITADDGIGDPFDYDTGYQVTPPSPPANIIRDTGETPGQIILTFYAKDCEGNIETIVVTLDKAKFNT